MRFQTNADMVRRTKRSTTAGVYVAALLVSATLAHGQQSEQQKSYCMMLGENIRAVRAKVQERVAIKAPPNANPAEQQDVTRRRNEIGRAIAALNEAFEQREEALLANGTFTNWY